jgi:peptidoglycan/xylan/chitin deacetylase (PgdA/CDA1 family)
VITLGILVFFIIPTLLLLEVLRCAYLEHRKDRIPILLYHRLVSHDRVERGGGFDQEPIYAAYDNIFAMQMQYLHDSGFTTLSLDEFLAIRRGKAEPPARPAVITFDDGYESNFTLAWPVLRRHAQKATIFVAPEPDAYTRAQVTDLDGFLNEEQMRELDRGGCAIESHTLTHCILSELEDDIVRYELTESKRRLSEVLGRPIRHLAIPRSGYSWRIRRLARQAGYETVCCNNKGSSNGLSNLTALPRIVIERDMTLDDFTRALSPRAGIVLRLVGNIKRIPEFFVGPAAAKRIRDRLYSGPFGSFFMGSRLKLALSGGAFLYLLGTLTFACYLVFS